MIGCVDGDETYGPTVAIVGGMRLRKKVRLFGVSLSALVKDHNQLALFHNASRGGKGGHDEGRGHCQRQVRRAFDLRLRQREKGRKVIFPAWRPV